MTSGLRQFAGYSEPVDFRLVKRNRYQRSQTPTFGVVVSLLLLLTGVILWSVSLNEIDLSKMDDLGLISVLPTTVLLALVIINLSFCITVSRRPLPMVLLFVHIVVLVFMLYGITAIIQEVPRFAIGWKLAGIIDYIMQTGTVDGKIDAFFNWPTFFILMAFVTQITGTESVVSFMQWAPLFFNLLYMGPLWMIFRAATSDKRLGVLGLWFFYLANWIGQDYLAPQAFNFFLFLVILAIILTWLRGPAWPVDAIVDQVRDRFTLFDTVYCWLYRKVSPILKGGEKPVAPSTPVQRAALVVILALIMMTMVSSHQLTPFATLAAVSALVFFNRCTVLTLPLLLGVLVVTWVMYMATPYLAGHIQHVSAPVGSVSSNIDANLTGRFKGSPGHIFINYTRTIMSFGIWVLAFLGGIRRFRNGFRDWGHIIIAVTPFPLLLLQAYGGELLLRIYLFSIPFMVFFAAALFYPSSTLGDRVRSHVILFFVSLMLLAGFLFTRYGNERMTYFTADEVASVQYLYENAEPGSQFVAVTGTLPWRYQDYRSYRYTTMPRVARDSEMDDLIGVMADRKFPASYLILTRSQQASGELYIGWPPGTWDTFVDAIHASNRFKSIFSNSDAEIFTLVKECRDGQESGEDCVAPEENDK